MKKFLLYFSVLFCLVSVVGCNEQDKAVNGEFLLGNFGADWKEETYYLVVPINWSGKSHVTIESIKLIKKDEKPITYEEDGIKYEFFGADPLKSSGIYGESDVGELKNIKDLEIDDDGKIALKLVLGEEVNEDSERRIKISFSINGKEYEKIVEWKTLEQLTTVSENNSVIPYTTVK
ncbi:hypothetical protein ACZ11_18050 [Lysinibacillus xylanilyticus]|uniref:Lipoprotein n=1 Tax=Lysinibacillus xylanilyticus TaxID=582475 RepID=A0A0K9F4K8_9BACI|nr:hypothetical protein [Lysinibacillus xylanilyticus]KMY29031.1 hypothetical protein ACZ11_18050 [Lysinibacillus xylanilyticus]